MSDARKQIADRYDGVVDLVTSPSGTSLANAIFKLTYSIGPDNGCQLTEPEPLLYDYRDETLKPRLQSASDFFDTKEKTDVVVQGSAFSPEEGEVTAMTVSVKVGEVAKHVSVFGDRRVVWTPGGPPRIEAPVPFREIPMTYQNAYGGLDWRVMDKTVAPELVPFVTERDHPGMYPRNPFGKGYLVEPGEVPDMVMPNLEDPNDLLTAQRLIVKDPRLWYRQPLPWCFDWSHPATYPRYLFFDSTVDAWYPAPKDAKPPEVQAGFLARNYREIVREHEEVANGPAPQFYQGASLGMIFDRLPTHYPITITGMHPGRRRLNLRLPETEPLIKIQIDDKMETVAPRLHSVVIKPAEEKLYMVFGGSMALSRIFIPGIHKHIPISASINNEPPISYQTPIPILEQLETAKSKIEGNP